MAVTTHQIVGKSLALLREGLTPFVVRELKSTLGPNWLEQAANNLRRDPSWRDDAPHLDVHALLVLMWDNWHEVFRQTLGRSERTLVSELREVRNAWAHQESFSIDDTYRAVDTIGRLLTAVSAPQVERIERYKQSLLRRRFGQQTGKKKRKVTVNTIQGTPQRGLLPWREVVTPHPDVASGNYKQAEFAADLNAVYRGAETVADEYRDPKQFFQRTYLTQGLRKLLMGALLRLSGDQQKGGDPVIELQTNFGGGKTHSMLALYHLFGGHPVTALEGIESIMQEINLPGVPHARRAVLVGTAFSPANRHQKADGTLVHTLWGEMAWQLGGAEGYQMIAEADQQGVNPGSNRLRELFIRYSPCLILIDEWVAHVRQLYNKYDLPAGSFDANLTFAQALTEAVKQSPGTLLVASLPASDIEIGGEAGREALARLKNTFSRLESSWRPASAEEGFEIVRRRLFEPISDAASLRQGSGAKLSARDAVIKSFAHLYRQEPQEFPPETREADYVRRMESAYPIHPELFDRLYSDWSTLEKFQRTRGVLRLMAAVIHALWERNDSSLLILPASIPLDNAPVQFELTRYLEDRWVPVIEKDIDGPHSLPLALDRENPNLGRYSANRRVARTIYLGSAPTSKSSNPGISKRRIKLGCTQPGESVSTFADALRRLTDKATYLYIDRKRYWFSTHPSVTRLAQDRALQFDEADVWLELNTRLRAMREKGKFTAVHAAPNSSADIPDNMQARLVIIGPEYPHIRGDDDSPACQEGYNYLTQRGRGPRIYQNSLIFLAADHTRLSELALGIRQYLAWKSIHAEEEQLDLNAFQRHQARSKHEGTDKTVNARIKETYIWLLVADQLQPRNPQSLELEPILLRGKESIIMRANRQVLHEELLVTEFSAIRLCMELNNNKLWQGKDHLGVKQLWEYFARYLYLARLRDHKVLTDAIQDGFSQASWRDSFAYAEGWDAERKRYLNLKAGQLGRVSLDEHSLIVKPAAAQRQLDQEGFAADTLPSKGASPLLAERKYGGYGAHPQGMIKGREGENVAHSPPPLPHSPTVPPKKIYRRFYGSIDLDPMRAGRQMGTISQEIIQHLKSLIAANVTITLEIEAQMPDGAPDHVVRTVSENARTLKFKEHGFEEA